LDLDTACWDAEQIQLMKNMGNVKSRGMYEARAPSYYITPREFPDSGVVRDNWIRAKYVRKEFVKQAADGSNDDEDKNVENKVVVEMPERPKEGWLSKCNERFTWQKRFFMLHHRFLYYFKAASDSYPKGQIDVKQMKLAFPEENEYNKDKPLVFDLEVGQRKYNLAADKIEDMFAWLHALRRAHLYYTAVNKEAEDETKRPAVQTIAFKDMGKPLKMGILTKQGGQWKSWKKRHCLLTEKGIIYYFKLEPTSPETLPEGGLSLDYCDVSECEDKLKKKNCFSVSTPGRVYFMISESTHEATEWVLALRKVTALYNKTVLVDFQTMKIVQKAKTSR